MGEGSTPTSPGFTPADLDTIGRVLERRLGRTLAGTERETTDEMDLIKIWVAGSKEPVYRLHRDKAGYCYVLYCGDNNWKLLECGTLEKCLSLYAPITP